MLSEEQVRETLRRHGYSEQTQVLGITEGTITTLNVYGARLVVPTDILSMEAPALDPKRRRLFHD